MGSSPIARSIFSFILLFVFCSSALAQVDPDPSRPFNQGEVIKLPATSAYLGDLPHPIKIQHDDEADHSLEGWLSTEVGWPAPGANQQPGLRLLAPGLFFEGIAYPFLSLPMIHWIPIPSSVEFLDFPAAAWWGREAAGGAVQIKTPAVGKSPFDSFSIWGGNGNSYGGKNGLNYFPLAVDLNFQRGITTPESGNDRLGGISKMMWTQNDDLKLESGLLAANNSNGDDWYSFFTDLEWFGPNFQTLQLKPFYQTAQLNGARVRECGGQTNYHFNIAGIAESHLGFGYSQASSLPSASTVEKEYAQAGMMGDVLGMVTLDAVFRLDFSSAAQTSFNYLLGLQGNQGDLTFLGDLGKGALGGEVGDTLRLDLGLRYQPNDSISGTLQYIHQDVLGQSLDGVKGKLQFEDHRTLFLFRTSKAEWEEQILLDAQNHFYRDASGKVTISFFKWDNLWVSGRSLSGNPLFWEAGAGFSVTKDILLFVSAANLDDLPLSWPDPSLPAGRLFHAGINGQF